LTILKIKKLVCLLCILTLLAFSFLTGNAIEPTKNPEIEVIKADSFAKITGFNLRPILLSSSSTTKIVELPAVTVDVPEIKATTNAKPVQQKDMASAAAAAVQTTDANRNLDTRTLAEERSKLLSDKGDKIVAAARGMTGTRYRYGGSSKNGIDCSGLIMVSIKNALGTSVPHNAASLYKMGSTIGKDKLMAGDLVFFQNTGSRKGITHVGIYIGNNKFIHASTSSGVKEDSLSTEYYAKRYAGARRLHS